MSGAFRPEPRSVTLLGATGSIGRSTVDVLLQHPQRFTVEALTADRNVDRLAQQARALKARLAVVADPAAYAALKDALAGSGIAVAAGPQAVVEAACRPSQVVVAAIVGAAGLAPTLAAVRRGAVVALANKECLVCAGALMMAEVAACGATLLPVDSEHNAIFQVFDFRRPEVIDQLILTASGGPFRTWSVEAMAAATPAQAVAHPTWSMGAKISVDSASMMNKGLEIIEAHWLFGIPEARIRVLVHPQSVVHSLVRCCDGSVLAQMGSPDMRIPLAYALAWPERIATGAVPLDLAAVGGLSFSDPDPARFPALRLAREALQAGASAATVLNAANEVAVARFLAGEIGFLDIARVVEKALATLPTQRLPDLEAVGACDAEARRQAGRLCGAIRR